MSHRPQARNDHQEGHVARVSESTLYSVIASLVVHAEQIRWTRLYNLLVVNTLFVLAWTSIFTSSAHPEYRRIVLLCLSLLGFLLSALWSGLGARSSDYLDDFHKKAEQLEKTLPQHLPRPFAISELRRKGVRRGLRRLTSSRWLVIWIPRLFAAMFVVFTIVALVDP